MCEVLGGIGSDGDDRLWTCEGGSGNLLRLAHALGALAGFLLLSGD